MSPRSYDLSRRRAAREETRRKIVRAIVTLHARHGIRATTHAMIAKEADVSIPTVYNHFPTQSEVVAACGGHLATLVPPVDPGRLRTLASLRDRLSAVAKAIFEGYGILEPWLRWGRAEAQAVPELQAGWDRRRGLRLELLRDAFEPDFGSQTPGSLLALADALLDFPSWEGFRQHHGLGSGQVVEMVVDVLTDQAHRLQARRRKRGKDGR